MRVAVIGRTEILYKTVLLLKSKGYEIGLIITSKESPEYTKTSNDFQKLAKKLKIPFISSTRIIDNMEFIKSLPEMRIGVSMNYNSIIPNEIINLFPLGILNAHAGDLPRYRGNACQAWAILNGERYIGLCVHKMIGGELDSGDIISRDYYPINLSTKITQVWDWISITVPKLFYEALKNLEKDPNFLIEKQSKKTSDILRCYPRKPEDGKINWKEDSVNIIRLVNASNKPFSGAFFYFKDKKIHIWDATLAKEENFLAIPGQITLISDTFIEVATGKGKIRLSSMESKGKKILPTKFFKSLRERLS